MQRHHAVITQRPGLALIGPARIDEAIADHPVARVERRTDQPRHVIRPRCGEQQRLGLERPAISRRIEQQRTDRFRARRTARLAREFDPETALAQVVRQQARLGGLAHALPAFEGDEAARAHPSQLWNALKTRRTIEASDTSSAATSGTRCSGMPAIDTTSSATSSPFATGACSGPS